MILKRITFLLTIVIIFTFFVHTVEAQTELDILKEELKGLQQKMNEFKIMRENMESLQKRIEELESREVKVKDVVKQEAKEAVKEEVEKQEIGIPGLSWRGYFSWNYEDSTARGANPAFDAFAFSLIPTVSLNEKIDIYSQIVFEHALFYDIGVTSTGLRSLDGRSSGELTLNDIYLTYNLDDRLKLRAGKFATPFGFWNTLQYAAPTYITIKQPGRDTFYSRGSSTDTNSNFFGRYSMGAWILGSYDIFSYDLYVVNGQTRLAQHVDDNRNKGFGGRLSADFSPGENHLKLLYSYYQDKLRAATTNPFFRQRTNALGTEFTAGDLKLTGEYALSKRGTITRNAVYLLAQYQLGEKFTPYAQYQWYDPTRRTTGKDAADYFTLGLGYQIIPWRTMLKFQIDKVKPEANSSQEYNRYLVGVAAAF